MTLLRRIAISVVFGCALLAFAGTPAKPRVPAPVSAIVPTEVDQSWMVEGEKRYRINCGRCHQPPHKFQPRAMAMAVRQMRVRAMLTEDDMKYVLFYVTH
ncbi:MAG: hypothetical protein ACRD2S_04075 [Terriglobales bacterium]